MRRINIKPINDSIHDHFLDAVLSSSKNFSPSKVLSLNFYAKKRHQNINSLFGNWETCDFKIQDTIEREIGERYWQCLEKIGEERKEITYFIPLGRLLQRSQKMSEK